MAPHQARGFALTKFRSRPAALDLSAIDPTLLLDAPDRLLGLVANLLLSGDAEGGGQWGTVIGLSLIAPAVVGIDKAIQLSRQRNPRLSPDVELTPEPVARLGT